MSNKRNSDFDALHTEPHGGLARDTGDQGDAIVLGALQRRPVHFVTFNAQKKKEEALRKLNDWMPQYNKFQEQLKPFKEQLEDYREANSSMRKTINDQTWAVHGHKLRADDLERQLWEYKEFIDSIPEDLRAELQLRFEQVQEQELELELEQSFWE